MKNKEFTVESFRKLFEDEFWQNHFKKYPENLKIFEDVEKTHIQSEEKSLKKRQYTVVKGEWTPEQRDGLKRQDKIS